MKISIISDLHLTTRYEKKLGDHLYKIATECDQLIINGDFWDGYKISFDQFINSRWSTLFPILKDKTVYLYGNHDREEWQDGRTEELSVEAKQRHTLTLTSGAVLKVEHGHRILNHQERNRRFLQLAQIPYYGVNRVEALLMGLLGWEYYKYFSKLNPENKQKLAKYIESELGKDEILVTGHTHAPYFSVEEQYINIGSIRNGLSTRLQIDNGVMELIYERY